jgi:hypothetical protein
MAKKNANYEHKLNNNNQGRGTPTVFSQRRVVAMGLAIAPTDPTHQQHSHSKRNKRGVGMTPRPSSKPKDAILYEIIITATHDWLPVTTWRTCDPDPRFPSSRRNTHRTNRSDCHNNGHDRAINVPPHTADVHPLQGDIEWAGKPPIDLKGAKGEQLNALGAGNTQTTGATWPPGPLAHQRYHSNRPS